MYNYITRVLQEIYLYVCRHLFLQWYVFLKITCNLICKTYQIRLICAKRTFCIALVYAGLIYAGCDSHTDASIVQIENCLYSCIDVISGGSAVEEWVGCDRKNWFCRILRAILGRVHTKTRLDECTSSSSWLVPCANSKKDGIRKRRGPIETASEGE